VDTERKSIAKPASLEKKKKKKKSGGRGIRSRTFSLAKWKEKGGETSKLRTGERESSDALVKAVRGGRGAETADDMSATARPQEKEEGGGFLYPIA